MERPWFVLESRKEELFHDARPARAQHAQCCLSDQEGPAVMECSAQPELSQASQMHEARVCDSHAAGKIKRVNAAQVCEACVSNERTAVHVQRVYATQVREASICKEIAAAHVERVDAA